MRCNRRAEKVEAMAATRRAAAKASVEPQNILRRT